LLINKQNKGRHGKYTCTVVNDDIFLGVIIFYDVNPSLVCCLKLRQNLCTSQ